MVLYYSESHVAWASLRLAKGDLKLLILLPLPPKFWGYRSELPYLAFMGLGMETSEMTHLGQLDYI